MSFVVYSSDVLIRLVNESEFVSLGSLTVEAFQSINPDHDLGGYADELRDVESRTREGIVLVAVDGDGTILGGVTYVPDSTSALSEFDDEDACGIRMLAVHPDYQGRGIGRALAEACIERAVTDERRLVILHSTRAMTAAHHVYQSLGFRRVPTRDIEIDGAEMPDGEPLLLMAFELVL